jgi:hypothetical protein
MKTKLIAFVIAQTPQMPRGKIETVAMPLKRAPHYYEKTVPPQLIGWFILLFGWGAFSRLIYTSHF